MSQLSGPLLILGGLFIAGLAVWEWRRPRQARGQDASAPRVPSEPHLEGFSSGADQTTHGDTGEPWIGEEALETAVPQESAWHESAAAGPLGELPSLRVDLPEDDGSPETDEMPDAVYIPELQPAAEAWEALEEGVGPARLVEPATPPRPAQIPLVTTVAEPAEPVQAPQTSEDVEPPLRVEWPPEAERHILALRLVGPGERFSGRMLRLALVAEGFRLGRFDIFHQPDAQGHALVSAASLTRPGTFDLEAMDAQHYAGLNLFTVLPGALPAAEAFEALRVAAEHLNERLQGEVQDEHGEPLGAERLAELRAALSEGPGEALT